LNALRGIYVAIITPMKKDRSIDVEGARQLVTWLNGEGVDGILALGGTGEATSLSQEEKKKIVKIAVDSSKNPVMAGVLNPGYGDAMDLIRYASDVGASSALVIPPYYGKHSQSSLVSYFAAIARTSSIPILIYNIPYKTGTNLEPQTVLQLAANHDNIIGIKECSRDVAQFATIAKGAPKAFYSMMGDDDFLFPGLLLGASGGILATANLIPRFWRDMFLLCKKGQFAKARELHFRVLPLVRVLFAQTNPMGLKIAMTAEGLPAGPTRTPIMPPTREYERKVLKCWEQFKGK
jgi:4-hydroxy-tetrahydrodipicolinate synthase